ncbi:unnamed protein product [Effrenium voratum]|nr:unnamed protein product [Effrenium voratum]
MGAAGSQLGRTLDVRLDLQDVTDPRSFGALLYTRAQGEVLCEDLGAACSLRLDDEDVIIIQLQRLQRSSVFHTGSDFAEVYLPWSKLRAELDGKEAMPS